MILPTLCRAARGRILRIAAVLPAAAWLGFAATAEAQTRGGTLVVAVGADPGHFNPAISTAGPLHAVALSLYNGLVGLDRDFTPVPELAREWRIADDGREVEFKLVPGVRWHDGAPFTSADVKFTFEQVLLRLHARARASLAPVLEAIDAPDPETVVFRLRRPHAALLRQLDVSEAPILPRHRFAGVDPMQAPANLHPIGTGPFRLESHRRDDTITMVRNETYFRPSLPHLDRLVFRVVPEANTQVLALMQGEVDYIARVAASDAGRLRARSVVVAGTTGASGGANCVMTIGFNLDRPLLARPTVRRALALAVDRAQILELVAFGSGRVAAAPISSGIGWAHLPAALDDLRFDPALAERLLDETGLPRRDGGLRATIDLVHFPIFARWGELLRQQLARVGIALHVRMLDPAALAQTVFTQRDFDTTLISYCNGSDPEIGVRRMVHSSAIGAVPFSNAAGYRDAEVDALFDRAGAALEQRERGALYQDAQRRLARDLPYLWLIETDFLVAHRADVAGLEPWAGQFAERAHRTR